MGGASIVLNRARIGERNVRDAVSRSWSGARDLNPGPHGPESHDVQSSHVDFCAIQLEISDPACFLVQIDANFQPDYYMMYYRTLMARAAPVQSRTAAALGLPRVGNPNATTMTALALR